MGIISNIKARISAKPFNIWTEKIDKNRKPDCFMSADWIADDGYLYYGHPLWIFFKSVQNHWWMQSFNNPANKK